MLDKALLEKTFLYREQNEAKEDLRHVSSRVHQTLSYNQSLVQFADTKANTLIMINSIFLASTTSFLFNSGSVANYLMFTLFFLASGTSILYCLAVITARGDSSDIIKRKDLIFFGDIQERKSVENFIFEEIHISDKLYCEDVIRRTYMIADIAMRKYRSYSVAQKMTVAGSVLWLINIVTLLISRI